MKQQPFWSFSTRVLLILLSLSLWNPTVYSSFYEDSSFSKSGFFNLFRNILSTRITFPSQRNTQYITGGCLIYNINCPLWYRTPMTTTLAPITVTTTAPISPILTQPVLPTDGLTATRLGTTTTSTTSSTTSASVEESTSINSTAASPPVTN